MLKNYCLFWIFSIDFKNQASNYHCQPVLLVTKPTTNQYSVVEGRSNALIVSTKYPTWIVHLARLELSVSALVNMNCQKLPVSNGALHIRTDRHLDKTPITTSSFDNAI